MPNIISPRAETLTEYSGVDGLLAGRSSGLFPPPKPLYVFHLSGNDRSDTALLAYSQITQLLCLINRHATVSNQTVQTIPQNVLKIKQYVDDNYLTLNTTSEIAEHFFYRREYVSRLFKEYFNTNLSDYLTSLKIRHSQEMLKKGASVTDACFQSGFRNMSTFTSAFRSQVYMNPSAYRKEVK